ncbi:MAG: hypothetical protein IPM54_39575 [Polyangiaceae bacterium]|nr:hypothetical protein [Polyangiaceae bacterium]
MQTLEVEFLPDSGAPPRTITLKLGAPYHSEMGWGVFVEILGFDEPYAHPIYGVDWAQAIELAAKILPIMLEERVADAGGGTLEPSFFTRPPHTPDLSDLPPEIVQALSNSSDTDE